MEFHNIDIIRIKSKLKGDLKNVTLNFVYIHRILGEIQIKYGNLPPNYSANHFLYELKRADNVRQFKQ